MQKRVIAYLSAVVVVAGVVGSVLDLWPEARTLARDHWWIGWLVALLLGAATVWMHGRVEDGATSPSGRARARQAEQEVHDLRRRIETFRPAPARVWMTV